MNLSLALDESEEGLPQLACEAAGIEREALRGFRIARKSLDARRQRAGGRRFRWILHVDLVLDARHTSPGFERAKKAGRVVERPPDLALEVSADEIMRPGARVVVVGAGPAGLFAAWVLARSGCRVDVVERGGALRDRGRALARFYRTRVPDPENNLLFGEGGAGTYSDGKLYTRIEHPLSQSVLEVFVACGAAPEIVFDVRAHIGTDRLHRILLQIREALIANGVSFHWNTRAEAIDVVEGPLRRVRALRTSAGELPCDALVLAIGHSARDTWEALARDGVHLEARPTQLGVRIEHPQRLIDAGRYGNGPEADRLGAAYYNLVCRASGSTKGAYSFCMCPGGQIVASVNTPGLLCTNGMSNSQHSSPFANAALVAPVGPAEWGPGVFAGVEYQKRLEASFFEAGGGDYTAPAQRASDFLAGCDSESLDRTSYKFGIRPARIDALLPPSLRDSLRHALATFERQLPGFAGPQGLLVGIESRCSAPMRVPRGREDLCARGFANLLPVGEGAGMAGGILSAAIDGARAAQVLLRTPI